MATLRPDSKTRPLFLVLLLAALASAIVGGGFWRDRESRLGGPEAPVVAYSAALERKDLAGALDQLAPEIRQQSASFVRWQLGNSYTILESAVRGTSVLDQLTGESGRPTEVVVTLEIQEMESGKAPWRTTQELPVGLVSGRWYLLKPPLEPSP